MNKRKSKSIFFLKSRPLIIKDIIIINDYRSTAYLKYRTKVFYYLRQIPSKVYKKEG